MGWKETQYNQRYDAEDIMGRTKYPWLCVGRSCVPTHVRRHATAGYRRPT